MIRKFLSEPFLRNAPFGASIPYSGDPFLVDSEALQSMRPPEHRRMAGLAGSIMKKSVILQI
jgi:hypothetical protein